MSSDPQQQQMQTEVRPLDSIRPYWRNPRQIDADAIEAVASSIREFGYQQPIVIDADGVIVIGHTRYAALRRLGIREVPVRVVGDLTAAQAKELRVLDNRLAELADWDPASLAAELADLDRALMGQWFPEVAPPPDAASGPSPESSPSGEGSGSTDFICPSCFHEWTLDVTPAMLRSGETL